ncbi:hypothetical protein BJX99DRAFT_270394 [Aspergillus californicus]
MSGLEVAGVVLGAIPVVITAIDLYRQRQMRIAFRSKEPYILRFIQALKAQQYLLQHDIEQILDGAGVDYDTSSNQITPSVFNDSAVRDAVNGYLGKNAGVYFDAVQLCHMVLVEVVGGIEGLGPVSKDLTEFVCTYSQAGGQYGLPKKVKFPLNRHDLNRRIWELDQATTTLRRISKTINEQRTHVTLQPSSYQAASFASAVSKVRHHARHLHLAISAAYSTRCHAQHEARLTLQSRSDLMRKYKTSKDKRALTFTVLLSPAMSPSGDTPSYQTDIKVTDEADPGDNTRAHSKVVIRAPTPPRTLDPPHTEIKNLCTSIQRARDGGIILDLHLLAGKGLTHCHLASSSSGGSIHLVANSDGFVSLEQLFRDTITSEWLQGHKIVLSSIVASSTLQLVSTPWLPLPLTSRSIRFPRAAAASLNTSSVPQPFVEQRFENGPTAAGVPLSCNIRDYMLELGILLLEIEHWQTIDDYRAERLSHGQSMPSTRYDLARIWAEASGFRILAPHHEAIERCIECTFATSGATLDWDDSVLRKSFAELVVRPLQENVPKGLR